jgi:molecular chaperone GrpE
MQEPSNSATPPPSSEAAQAPDAQNPAQEVTPEKKIAELEAQLKEKDGKYLYLYAEFDNFKKRNQKERADLLKFGWENVARDLLQVLDNLDRALQHIPQDTQPVLVDGIRLVQQQFLSTLTRQGVQTIATEGQAFDPNFHEAIGQIPGAQPAGTIVKEEMKGYTLHGRLLRPARVLVSSGVAPS